MPTEAQTIRFLGVDFARSTYEEVAQELNRLSKREAFSFIVTPNVDHILMLHPKADSAASQAFRAAYDAAEMRLCDSRILQKLARLRGIRLEVVTGSDLTAYMFRNGHFTNRKLALVGGDEQMIQQLHERFPRVQIVQHLPPMGVMRHQRAIDAIIDFVKTERPDYVLMAIGAPQSEIIAHQGQQGGQMRGVGLCIGASIEFLLDRKPRAPHWMQRLGFEWAFRLLSEPRRLWRRYLLTGPRIFLLASRWRKA